MVKETNFSTDFFEILNQISTKYILFGVDDVVYFDSVDFEMINKIFNKFPEDIFGFSLRLGLQGVRKANDTINEVNIAGQTIYSINWTQGQTPATRYPFELCATIYKTELVKKIIKNSRKNNSLCENLFAPNSITIRVLSKIIRRHKILKRFGYFYNPNTLESWNCHWSQNHAEQLQTRVAIAKQTDIVITTSAGRFLQTYKDTGVPCCAFIPNVCDPDIQCKYDVDEKWKAVIIFTGKSEHTKLDRNNERYNLVEKLSQKSDARIYGAFGIPRVEGIDYFYAISGSRIGLSINIANDVKLYHSDRLINCISCGTLALARRVPDTDLLFEDGVHVKYFDMADEFFELADWYLKHDEERERIAKAGMQRVHTEFNCEKIAGHLLDLIETGTYDAPWAEIL